MSRVVSSAPALTPQRRRRARPHPRCRRWQKGGAASLTPHLHFLHSSALRSVFIRASIARRHRSTPASFAAIIRRQHRSSFAPRRHHRSGAFRGRCGAAGGPRRCQARSSRPSRRWIVRDAREAEETLPFDRFLSRSDPRERAAPTAGHGTATARSRLDHRQAPFLPSTVDVCPRGWDGRQSRWTRRSRGSASARAGPSWSGGDQLVIPAARICASRRGSGTSSPPPSRSRPPGSRRGGA